MKKIAVLALGSVCLAASSFGAWLDEEQQSVRLDYIYTQDVGSDDADGVEVAFGASLYELDDVALFVMHSENDAMESQRLGISVQEHYPISVLPIPLVPYLGAAAGYGWLDIDSPGATGTDPDKGGFLARIEAGALLKLCDYFALSAGARLNFSTHNIFLEEDGGTEDTEWDFNFGARFYY